MRLLTRIIANNAYVPLLDTREFDECVIGYCRKSNRFIYSATRVIRVLTKRMDPVEAVRYYHQFLESRQDSAIWCFDYFND